MSLIKVFNSQFMEFLKDVQVVLPNDLNIKTAKYYTENLIKVNPSLLVKSWYELVIIPYKNEIDKGDFEFFLNKEYSSDLETIDNNDGILETIKTIKSRVKDLTDDDKKKIIKYTQNLTKISLMYKAEH
tara:strand:+ start:5872 stop:6258 length:387 start_codon:yes stop_codon:yes gene_type:complete